MAAFTATAGANVGFLAGSDLKGSALQARTETPRVSSVISRVACRASAEDHAPAAPSRRNVLLAAGVAASTVLLREGPALAAYGEAANVFGSYRGKTDFYALQGDGFSLSIPAKWNPSREFGEFANVVARYEDNFDATSNLVVIAEPTSLKSVKDLGSPLDFMEKYKFLLGIQSFEKESKSEGGFAQNATLTAAILENGEEVKDGKTYYKVSILSRTADGDEGGKHQLFTAAVSGGKLYILKVQAGDKRWFKGARKFVEGCDASFTVA